MGNERQQQILKLVEDKGEIRLQELKDVFPEVSMMTLRRDLISLEIEGRVKRTCGGAVCIRKLSGFNGEEDAYSKRAMEKVEAKIKIAEKAVKLVEKGRSIYFDAGSTIMCLAKALPDDNFSFVTSGVNIALELIRKTSTQVVTLGGVVNRNTLSISGPNALSELDRINIDVAFMSASGFSIESGFTVSNIYECELKKKVLEKAKEVIMLLDTGKINKNLQFTYGYMENVDIWVCEKALPQEVQEEAIKNDVMII